MKIGTFEYSTMLGPIQRMGILVEKDQILDPQLLWKFYFSSLGHFDPLAKAKYKIPSLLSEALDVLESPLEVLQETLDLYARLVKKGNLPAGVVNKLSESIQFKAPLDKIHTYRDFYAHEKHVKTSFEKRGEKIPQAWYEIPAYYKGATANFIGHNEVVLWPSYTQVLDYELELAVVIQKDGQNISAKDAVKHIFGFTILNDISARDIQKKEMAIRLGPAKGKDFCSVIGPIIVTMDEYKGIEPNLTLTAKVNGQQWSRGKSGDSQYSFAEMIEHVSRDEWVRAGDLFGSGTVGTGCGLELDKWIKPGDVLELEAETIGVLTNVVGQPVKK